LTRSDLKAHFMQFELVDPPMPSLRRWVQLGRRYRGQSLLRMLEYERLSTVALSGRVLDMGGGRNARYIKLLPPDIQVESVNIDPKIEPTHLIKPGAPLPFADDTFDAVLCFNTLEHIYDATDVLRELHRVVKPGAQVHVIVPFMFRIHGHPDDYFRATPSWWQETFSRVGFAQLEFQPLVWGRKSTTAVVPGFHGLFTRLRMHMAMLIDILYSRLALRGNTISGARGRRICGTSPGWYMAGRK
jgi:SAM-dependent methyltransferase